jgi:hypothetical protein
LLSLETLFLLDLNFLDNFLTERLAVVLAFLELAFLTERLATLTFLVKDLTIFLADRTFRIICLGLDRFIL